LALNWKGGGSPPGRFEPLSLYFLLGTEENQEEPSLKVAGHRADNRKDDLPNTKHSTVNFGSTFYHESEIFGEAIFYINAGTVALFDPRDV
jgi:hypothetical protein